MSTTSIQSQSNTDITQIITVAIIVCGLIICVIFVFVGVIAYKCYKIAMQSQQKRQEPTATAMIPMPATATAQSCNNDPMDGAAKHENLANTQMSNNNAYSDFQQPFAAGGAGGGSATGDNFSDPFAMYESLSDNQG